MSSQPAEGGFTDYYGFLLAGLSQLASDLRTNSATLAEVMEDDFSDGTFDGRENNRALQVNGETISANLFREDLADAIARFGASARNASGAEPREGLLEAMRVNP